MKITCDQVAWLQNAFHAYKAKNMATASRPSIAFVEFVANDWSLLMEVMEVLNLEFADDRAANNAMTYIKAQTYRDMPKETTHLGGEE